MKLELKRANIKHSIYYQTNKERCGAYNVGYCGIGVGKTNIRAFIYHQKAAEIGNAGMPVRTYNVIEMELQ